LVLTRKIGQKIWIGEDICIILTGVEAGGKARIGIIAPKDIPIQREELIADNLSEYQRRISRDPRV
jgi:carbon storage regulator